ncbi:MAG: glycosyltransferase family 1 protein [Rhodospirillales bacterium]|nr:glycosyltransferase family 1 protein [Rhodospirillales bacterium]
MGGHDGAAGPGADRQDGARILLVTDAWYPQVNGVVRTLEALRSRLVLSGREVRYVTPEGFRSVPCPTYPEIRLSVASPGTMGQIIGDFRPNAIHIATEGPLGLSARNWCRRHGLPFTTAFHTRFPEYIHARWRIPATWTYAWLRWFHRPSSGVMVATQSIEDDLAARGFRRIRRWTRGVDTALFRPRPKNGLPYPRPISLFVGRVSVEKNIEDFLRLDIDGTKVVVGDGPQRAALRARYPDVVFAGAKEGEELAQYYAAADVFVFPSRTDTFGLVMLEALACGVPVAAYPVPGPRDVLDGAGAGCLDEDLGRAVRAALGVPPEICRAHAERYSWDASVRQFLDNIHVFR